MNINFRHYHCPSTRHPVVLTACELQIKQYKFYGEAWMMPGDQFSKSKGRKLSLARAIEKAAKILNLSKMEKRKIWWNHFETCADMGGELAVPIAEWRQDGARQCRAAAVKVDDEEMREIAAMNHRKGELL